MDRNTFIQNVIRAVGASKAEREGVREYNSPTYGSGVGFKNILIGVTLFVAIVIGFFWLFT
jgi:hypothetical protein